MKYLFYIVGVINSLLESKLKRSTLIVLFLNFWNEFQSLVYTKQSFQI